MSDELVWVRREGFLHTSQVMWNDKTLSLRDRGLLATLLSVQYKKDWKYSIRGLCEMVPDGRSSIAAGIKSLEKHGYLLRVRYYEVGKFKNMIYLISDKPEFLDPIFRQEKIDEYSNHAGKSHLLKSENLMSENLMSENLTSENRAQLNNKRINKENYKEIEEEDYSACACEEPLSSSPDELDIPVAGDSESYPGERDVESFKAVYGYDEIDKQISDRYERLYGYDETFNLRNDVWLATEMMIGFIRDRRDFKTKNKTIPYKDMLRSFIHLNPVKTAGVMEKLRDGERWRVIGNKRAYLLAMLYDEGSVSN